MRLLVALVCTIFVSGVAAQSVRVAAFDADLEPRSCAVDDTAIYFVSVKLVAESRDDIIDAPVPKPPPPDGCTLEFIESRPSSSERMTVFNGVMSRQIETTTNFLFRVTPKRVGRLEIPGFDYEVAGKSLKIPSRWLAVSEESPANRFVSLAVSVSKTKVYVNEPIKLRWEFATEKPILQRSVSLEVPWATTPNGFEMVPVPEMRQGFQVDLNGAQALIDVDRNPSAREGYRLVIERTLLPLAPGRVDLGGTRARAELALRTRPGILSTEVLESARATARSDAIIIDVLDAPELGRPASYAGAVGDFEAVARWGETKIRAGDGVTLTLEVTGRGGLESLPLPDLSRHVDFDVYPPDRRTEDRGDGRKALTASWLFVPKSTAVEQVPRFEFSWFAPSKSVFVTTTAEATPLSIRGNVADSGIFEGSLTPKRAAEIRVLGEGLRPIREKPGNLDAATRPPALPWIAVLSLLPIASAMALSVLRARRAKLGADVGHQRRRRASAAAESRLSEARALLSSPKGFHGRLSRTLSGFIGDKLALPPAAVSAATVDEILRAGGAQETTRESARAVLLDLDAKEFGGASTTEADRRADLDVVSRLVERLDREIRR